MQFKLHLKVHFTLLKRPQIHLGFVSTNSELLNSFRYGPGQIMNTKTSVLIGALSCCISAAIVLFPVHHYHPTALKQRTASSDLAAPSFTAHLRRTRFISDDPCHQDIPQCDDFPPDFPPPDSPAVSVFCVDPNGCCNFKTVQEAVDAVPNFSQKRNVVWINKGIYL